MNSEQINKRYRAAGRKLVKQYDKDIALAEARFEKSRKLAILKLKVDSRAIYNDKERLLGR